MSFSRHSIQHDWKNTIFGVHVHVSPGSAETLVSRGEITNHRSIAYFLSNMSAKNYQNRSMSVEVMCNISVVCLRHSVGPWTNSQNGTTGWCVWSFFQVLVYISLARVQLTWFTIWCKDAQQDDIHDDAATLQQQKLHTTTTSHCVHFLRNGYMWNKIILK